MKKLSLQNSTITDLNEADASAAQGGRFGSMVRGLMRGLRRGGRRARPQGGGGGGAVRVRIQPRRTLGGRISRGLDTQGGRMGTSIATGAIAGTIASEIQNARRGE